ncbi:hypothetical protein F5X99DRAFT_382211 [Biscogniauxia marginata]|nr:hypothetical protein F5X99DRAFT_382211 [Biscogniauxia marginata]
MGDGDGKKRLKAESLVGSSVMGIAYMYLHVIPYIRFCTMYLCFADPTSHTRNTQYMYIIVLVCSTLTFNLSTPSPSVILHRSPFLHYRSAHATEQIYGEG